jgi:excisionase family DNA binding protein
MFLLIFQIKEANRSAADFVARRGGGFHATVEELAANRTAPASRELKHDADHPVLLTAREAAQLLGLRESTLRDHTRRGLVPHVRIGRLLRYRERDLLAWLDGLRQPVQRP